MFRVQALFLLLAGVAPAQGPGDWPVVGHDPGGTRYSPLLQINTQNVSKLRHAWTFHSGAPGSEATPLVIDGRMYLAQPNGVFALESESGKLIWKLSAPGAAIRGLAYWPGDQRSSPRLFVGILDKLVAIDASTGVRAREFGVAGEVNLKKGVLGDLHDGRFLLNSPPAIYKNIVITGGANGEGSPSLGTYGDIRAWNARTGDLVWTFHTVPREGEPGNETWPRGGWRNRSGTNTWGFFTVDTERGLLFAPTGSPTSDDYGADRHGDNLYGNSLLALEASTGRLRWYRQLVHHDLWDYDLAAAPALIEIAKDGRKIPAVAQMTKMGLLFLFNRVTGEPLFGLEERTVPKSPVPGEIASPTQPFPLKPVQLGRTSFQYKDLYNLTPEHAKFCRELIERNKIVGGNTYTPMPLAGNLLVFPGTLGGGNWGGVSFDPELGYLFINVMNLGLFGHMEARQDSQTGATVDYVRKAETPVGKFWDPKSRIPCTNPPFGELIAIRSNTGDIAWSIPLGTVPALENEGARNTGALNLGGSIATAGGLVFIAATNDRSFRAYESKSGRLLWEHPLDANGHAVPITYLGRNGTQYVAVMAGGGGGFFGSPLSDSLMAFALENRIPPTNPEPISADRSTRVSERSTSHVIRPGRSRKAPNRAAIDLVTRKCGQQCHGLDIVTSQRLSKSEWQTTVAAMVARGMVGTREEIQLVVEYLSKEFGPRSLK
ncbi:MAG: PQQ-binding-like beta-propeller repeat protein [Bryobacterales bacterium]|nr:PQQ-binding-like beta-propeller repeat protein [Bryobacterales bacterium]